MFFPPKRITIVAVWIVAIAMVTTNFVSAQHPDYQRRLAEMQAARGESPQAVRLASAVSGEEYANPPAPPRARRLPQTTSNGRFDSRQTVGSGTRVASRTSVAPAPRVATRTSGSRPVTSRYSPAHMRTAQLHDQAIEMGGSPIVGDVVSSGPIVDGPVYGGCASCGGGGCASCHSGAYETIIDDGYVEEVGYSDCGGCGDCYECGDMCCGRGGCPPGDCWLTGVGGVLYNGEYFGGGVGFQNSLLQHPRFGNAFIGDSSFGYQAGMNLSMPLCRLTCGLFSGQIGFRSVQTNFIGNEFSAENRDQHFVTMGFYRRVDYGLQFGLVADILHEDWFTETTTVQVRSDLAWVWAGGTTAGFRYADNTQDDIEPGTVLGTNFHDILTRSEDWYRFYLKRDLCGGGWGELSFGWTDSGHTIFGLETDVPINDRWSAQSSFTHYLNDDNPPTSPGTEFSNRGDAWNVTAGLVFRPRGRSWYKSYDRPLFNVADNGTMVLKRE